MANRAETNAMRRALHLAQHGDAVSAALDDAPGTAVDDDESLSASLQAQARAHSWHPEALPIPHGPNPRVGCVILDADGTPLAEGWHRGAGTPHAEQHALERAVAAGTSRLAGATAVVTLEPCAHHGRTPPCADALIAAGIGRVVYAQPDPNPVAAGGAAALAEAGVDVEGGVLAAEAAPVNLPWSTAMRRGYPFVTAKVATSLDGAVAAADGTSRWITGPLSRHEVHALRRTVDAVAVGTGTVLADDPQLTVRDPAGRLAEGPQPLRVVLGNAQIPPGYRVRDDAARMVQLPTAAPEASLAELASLGVTHVLLEGGPTVLAAFLAAGLVDRLIWFQAPILLGEQGRRAIDLEVPTLLAAPRWKIEAVRRIAGDLRIDLVPAAPGVADAAPAAESQR